MLIKEILLESNDTVIDLAKALQRAELYSDEEDQIGKKLQNKLSRKIRTVLGLKGGIIQFFRNRQAKPGFTVNIDHRESSGDDSVKDKLVTELKTIFGTSKVKVVKFEEYAFRFHRTTIDIVV